MRTRVWSIFISEKSQVFNVKRFNIMLEKWSAKNIIFDSGNSEGYNKSMRVIVNRSMASEVIVKENKNLGFISNSDSF